MTAPHLIRAEYAYTRYCLEIEPGITLEDLLRPEVWSRSTDGQLRPRDKVRVIAKDGTFDCDLVVSAIMPGAGVLMRVDTSAVPGSAERTRLEAIEAEVRMEAGGARRTKLDAALRGEQA